MSGCCVDVGVVRALTCRVAGHVHSSLYVSRIQNYRFDSSDQCIYAGNILILRGDIEILPPDRQSVSYEHLAQLLAEYLLRTCPDVDISSALTTMPVTRSMSQHPYSVRFS